MEGHADPRWREVIPLYAGSGTDSAARSLIEALMGAEDSGKRGDLLADAYLASERGLKEDKNLRARVLDVLAGSTASSWPSDLERFPVEEVALIANSWLARRAGVGDFSGSGQAFRWLQRHSDAADVDMIWHRLANWRSIPQPALLGELVVLAHFLLPATQLVEVSADGELYKYPGPKTSNGEIYCCQGGLAIVGLGQRSARKLELPWVCLLRALEAMVLNQCGFRDRADGYYLKIVLRRLGKEARIKRVDAPILSAPAKWFKGAARCSPADRFVPVIGEVRSVLERMARRKQELGR